MSEGLVEWLRAQLGEDQRIAEAAIQGPWRTGAIAEHLVDDVIYGRSPFAHGGPGGDKIVQVANVEVAWQKEANAAHMINWDPSRVLREVEAKRKILDDFDRCWRTLNAYAADEIREVYYDQILPAMALPYADRPGFREEWRVR